MVETTLGGGGRQYDSIDEDHMCKRRGKAKGVGGSLRFIRWFVNVLEDLVTTDSRKSVFSRMPFPQLPIGPV